MKHGTYIGPIEHLKGKTALLQDGFGPTIILAQFDEVATTRDGLPMPDFYFNQQPPPVALGFGWHQFHPWEFQLDEREEA